MSSPQQSLDPRLDFVSSLAAPVCCPPDQDACEDSDFCRRMEEQPQTSKYQNAEQFCGWFVSSGCSQLSREIQNFTAEAPQCRLLSEDEKKRVVRSLNGDTSPPADLSREERFCRQAMTDRLGRSDRSVEDRCDGMGVADLYEAPALCNGITPAAPGPSSTTPPPPGGGGTSWLQDINDFIRDNGTAVVTILTTVAAVLAALKAAAVKFRTSIVGFVKTIPKWVSVWKLFTAPKLELDRGVVASQLRGLSSNEKFKAEGKLFGELEPVVQEFIAQQAINEWNGLWRITKNVHLYLVKDSGNITTGLPDGFIEGFAKKFLRPHKVEALKTAAANWARTELPRDQPVQEGPPEDRSEVRRRNRQTSPELRPVVPNVDPIRGKPISKVVLKQLEMLKDDATYEPYGSLFAVQKGYVQLYLAELAINRWHALSSDERGDYLRNDTLPLRGALPYDFVRAFATKYLKEELIERVHTSAAEWAKDAAKKMGSEIVPAVENVKNQILMGGLFDRNTDAAQYAAEIAVDIWSRLDSEQRGKLVDITHQIAAGDLPQKFIDTIESRVDPRAVALKLSLKIVPNAEAVTRQIIQDTRLSEPTSEFIARMAMDRWLQFDEASRANFVEPSRSLQSGELPWMFIRWFKKSTNLRNAGKLLGVYDHLLVNRREIQDFSISIVYDRLLQIYAAWKGLPPVIKKVFEEQDANLAIPASFLELMRTSLRVSTRARERLQAATESWEYDASAAPLMYEDVNISLVMRAIVQKNPGFSRYPSVLEARARALVDDWKNLPENVRAAFKIQDTKNGTTNGAAVIPLAFVKLWSQINGGIGVTGRTSLEPDDDPDKNRGGGGGGGTPGGAGGAGGPTNTPGSIPRAPVVAGAMGMMQPSMSMTAMFARPLPLMGLFNYALVPARP